MSFAFWRSLAAGVAMLALVPLSRGSWPNLRWMALSIGLYCAVVSLLITAMTRSTAATGILLLYTGPAFCALFAWLLQGRRISARTGLALGIAITGVAIMILGAPRERDVLGPICGAISGVAFGALILTLEKIDRLARTRGGEVNPFAIVCFNNLGAAAILLVWCKTIGNGVRAQPWQLGLVCATGVIQLGIPYSLFQLALRRVLPVEASLLILLEPVLNPIWVWLAVGERPDRATFVGGAAILVSMIIEATRAPDPAALAEATA
jgi:drug/metabolite transporter (DMT)-like permease